MTPTMIDSVVAIIMLLSAVFALFRGFVREMLTIVNLAGAALCAYWFSPQLQPVTDRWFDVDRTAETADKAHKIWGMVPPPMMSTFCSYAIVFFGVLLILTLAGLYISSTIKALGLGPADKALGLVFGLVRGFLIVFLMYLPFGYFMNPDDYPQWAKESVTVPVLEKAYAYGDEHLKDHEELNAEFKQAGDTLREKADRAHEAAREAAEDVKDHAEDAKDELKDKGRDIKEGARNVTDDILTDSDKSEPRN